MSDDWANRFMPSDSKQTESFDEPLGAIPPISEIMDDVVGKTEAEPFQDTHDEPIVDIPIKIASPGINEILISLNNIHGQGEMLYGQTLETLLPQFAELGTTQRVLMSALDIIRQDQRIVSNENQQILLALTEVVGKLNQRLDSLEGAVIRKMGQLEFAISKPPPEPMTNVMDFDPSILKQIREEATEAHTIQENELTMEEEWASINKIAAIVDEENPGLFDEGDLHPDLELVKDVPSEVLGAYQDWKFGEQTGSSGWHAFMRVCKGAKEAKSYRDKIETQLAIRFD